jgi:hypothetical protein
MTSFPRLLCLAVLATTTAFAQDSVLPSDPSLANDNQPVKTPPVDVQTGVAQPVQTPPIDAQPREVYSKPAKPSAAVPAVNPAAVNSPAVNSEAAPVNAAAVKPGASASQPTLQTRSNAAETVLPTATVLRLKLLHPISTASARPGERFFATLTRPVEVDGRAIIPAGTSVTCQVDSAHAASRFSRKPSLSIKALSMHTPTGEVLDFSASVIDTTAPHKLDVDQEGRVHGAGFSPMDKAEMGSLAGVGLIAGAVIAGPEGLFIGTASGAALAAGHIVVKHRNLTLPAGTELIFELDGPATITHPQMGG